MIYLDNSATTMDRTMMDKTVAQWLEKLGLLYGRNVEAFAPIMEE